MTSSPLKLLVAAKNQPCIDVKEELKFKARYFPPKTKWNLNWPLFCWDCHLTSNIQSLLAEHTVTHHDGWRAGQGSNQGYQTWTNWAG